MKKSIRELIPKSVAITQLGSVRDCLLTIPLAVDIKRVWPETKVTWIIESNVQPLLDQHACTDQVICLDSGWLRRPKGIKGLWSQLREHQIELILDPTGLTKSGVLALLTGAKTRVGFASPVARELSPWFYSHCITPRIRHRLDTIRELLTPWHDVQAGMGEYSMPDYKQSSVAIQSFLSELSCTGSQDWIAIHPGALWPPGLWPVERFGEIARKVFKDYGLKTVIVWFGEDERLLSEVIREKSDGAAITAPKLSLVEMVELFRKTMLLICNDSIALHLASSIGAPCLSLHGPTWADEFGAYGATSVAIQSPHPHVSRRTLRRGPNTAMQAIEADEVLYYVQRLIRRVQTNTRGALNAAKMQTPVADAA